MPDIPTGRDDTEPKSQAQHATRTTLRRRIRRSPTEAVDALLDMTSTGDADYAFARGRWSEWTVLLGSIVSIVPKNSRVCYGYIAALCAVRGVLSSRHLLYVPLPIVIHLSHTSCKHDIEQQQQHNHRPHVLPAPWKFQLSLTARSAWYDHAARDACRQRLGRDADVDGKPCRNAAVSCGHVCQGNF